MSTLEYRARPAAGEPEGALVLLHGRGSDEHDLLGLADAFDPDRRLTVVTPRGPIAGRDAGTLGGAHWYRLGGIPTPDPATFDQTFGLVGEWLDGVGELTGVPWRQTVLGGFSQGAVMSYALGLGEGRPSPAGIVALSGFIPQVPGFELELDSRAGLPVAIAHGAFDPVIPAQFGREAAERLGAAGLDVAFREFPVAHSVAPALPGELRPWLERAVAAGAAAGGAQRT